MKGSTNLGERYGMQVVCSSMVFRKNVDIGTLTLGDMHKKSTCVKFRVDLEEIVQSLQHVKSTQLHLFTFGLRVDNATNDIDPDIHYTKTLLVEEVMMALEDLTTKTLGFVAEV